MVPVCNIVMVQDSSSVVDNSDREVVLKTSPDRRSRQIFSATFDSCWSVPGSAADGKQERKAGTVCLKSKVGAQSRETSWMGR